MGVTFSQDGARRIAAATRAFEAGSRGGGIPDRGRGPDNWNPGTRTVQLPMGGIGANSSATCTFYKAGVRPLSLDSYSAVVHNDFSIGAPGGGAVAKVGWEGGIWTLLTWDCPA
jgi:hypothetical protein